MPHKIQRYGQGGNEKMSESKQTRRDVIDAQLQKTKAELATAKHWEAKLRNQIKGMTEKESPDLSMRAISLCVQCLMICR